MRIALAGASGTGKTTLARKMSKHFGVPMLEYDVNGTKLSVARFAALTLFGEPNPYIANDNESRTKFFNLLADLVSEFCDKNYETGYVWDRSPADQWAYAALHGPEEDFHNPETLVQMLRGFDTVLVCPMSRFFNLGNDSVRKTSLDYHSATEALILRFLATYAPGKHGSVVRFLRENNLGG